MDNQRTHPGENGSLNLAYVFPSQFLTLTYVVRHQYHVRCLHAYADGVHICPVCYNITASCIKSQWTELVN
jgi:hypothetical protein